MKKSAVTAVSIILVSSFMFSGCQKDPELTREQKKWISQMEDWYPDDEFTYTHHGVAFLGAYQEHVIILKSENFPDFTFEFSEKDGELYSYYPTEYHREAIEEYYTDTLDGYFDARKMEVKYKDHAYKSRPCEYMSDEEFIEKYTTNELDIYLTYKNSSDYPTQDEMVAQILKYADYLEGDCELDVYLKSSSRDKEYDYLYDFICHNGKITCLLVYKGDRKNSDYDDLCRNMQLEDALEEYAY